MQTLEVRLAKYCALYCYTFKMPVVNAEIMYAGIAGTLDWTKEDDVVGQELEVVREEYKRLVEEIDYVW